MTAKTGINKGIEKGVNKEQFREKVICQKCGKEIEYVLGSDLFRKCPRCNAELERESKKQENKQVKRIIMWDILRRSKKFYLNFGFILTLVALAYNITGFFTGLFADGRWWLALLSLPIIIIAWLSIRKTKKESASRKYKFYARLALIVNFIALGVIIVTAIPPASDFVNELINI